MNGFNFPENSAEIRLEENFRVVEWSSVHGAFAVDTRILPSFRGLQLLVAKA